MTSPVNTLRKLFPSVSASERVARIVEVHLVPGAGDLRPGDIWAPARPQGDVRRQDQEEQDHQL